MKNSMIRVWIYSLSLIICMLFYGKLLLLSNSALYLCQWHSKLLKLHIMLILFTMHFHDILYPTGIKSNAHTTLLQVMGALLCLFAFSGGLVRLRNHLIPRRVHCGPWKSACWECTIEKSGSAGVLYWQIGLIVLAQFGNTSQRTGPAVWSRRKATFPIPGRLTGICIKSAIWWSVFSRKSSGFAELPPDITSRLLPSWPLCILPLSLFCCFSTISAFFQTSPKRQMMLCGYKNPRYQAY